MALRQPLNGGLPRRAPSPYDASASKGWNSCYVISVTVSASAILATLVTFGVLNFLLSDMTLPPLPNRLGSFNSEQELDQQQTQVQAGAAMKPSAPVALSPAARPPALPPRPAVFVHPFSNMQHIYTLPATDESPRCLQSQICDGDHSCGPDKLGCVTATKDRQAHVRKAIAWAWQGYRCAVRQGKHRGVPKVAQQLRTTPDCQQRVILIQDCFELLQQLHHPPPHYSCNGLIAKA
jgi:hypothetical protein